ncbi:MAG: CBS domain-containing protein [Deltaproteobacteria bacterium]|nr:CBS domain-containing protein [Deltaproteobacteria bacterium]
MKIFHKEGGKYHCKPIVVVVSENSRVLRIINQHDLLMALETRYKDIGLSRKIAHSGFSPKYPRSMMEAYKLWDKPLSDICKKAFKTKVKDFMVVPSEGEYIGEDARLDEAVHQFIMRDHDFLFVRRGKDIMGISRLIDIFMEVKKTIESCEKEINAVSYYYESFSAPHSNGLIGSIVIGD